MTAIDLLHHVFDWEVASGIARIEPPGTDSSDDEA